MMLKCEEIKSEDLSEIYSFSKEVLEETWAEQETKNSHSNPIYKCFKAIDSEILGVIHATFILDECYINFFSVKKEFQNKRIGNFLLSHLLNYAKDNNIEKVVLEVRQDNVPAIAVYKKAGFKEVGLRKNFYKTSKNMSTDAIVLSLSL